MTPFAAIIGGGGGGLGGAAMAHVLVTLANRSGMENWLKGPYGPPFFELALYTGILYSGIALGLSRRPGTVLIGFLGPFLGIALPMGVLTRTATWGMDPQAPPTLAWFYSVMVLYIASMWGTLLALGARLAEGRRWLGALGGAAGAYAGYLALKGFLWAFPSYQRVLWSPTLLIPSPIDLFSALLTGAGLGIGIWLSRGTDLLRRQES